MDRVKWLTRLLQLYNAILYCQPIILFSLFTYDLLPPMVGSFHNPYDLPPPMVGSFHNPYDLPPPMVGSFHNPYNLPPPMVGSFHNVLPI
jgi:hypothetical protein